jgi:hypothetical protein
MADVDAPIGHVDKPLVSPVLAAPSRSLIIRSLALITLVALLTRIGEFGNPLSHVDDQFYLFTGKAILRGELPYVDVWDRKPIGLFLIYAGVAALGGPSMLVYRVVAFLFALSTSFVILKIGERVAGWKAGVAAAIAYLVLLPTLGGANGQSPIFYNLLIAGAALLAIDAFVRGRGALWLRAVCAMALCGLAIQIKPTSLFEGIFFGLLFLASEWRNSRSLGKLAALTFLMIAVALAPTVAAFATYAWFGHLQEMWTATVVSNFTKSALPWPDKVARIPQVLLFLSVPMLIAGRTVAVELRERGPSKLATFLAGWLVAALMGYVSVANFFDHYALPLMVPLSVAMTPAFAEKRDGLLWLILSITVPVISESNAPASVLRGNLDYERLVQVTKRELRGGCLYVYLGPTALYTDTNACHLSEFVFPDHLETQVEATALPVRPEKEVERIFSQRPSVVVTEPRRFLARNNATAAIVERHLACDYRLTDKVELRGDFQPSVVSVWKLRDNGPHRCVGSHPPLGIVQLRTSSQ